MVTPIAIPRKSGERAQRRDRNKRTNAAIVRGDVRLAIETPAMGPGWRALPDRRCRSGSAAGRSSPGATNHRNGTSTMLARLSIKWEP